MNRLTITCRGFARAGAAALGAVAPPAAASTLAPASDPYVALFRLLAWYVAVQIAWIATHAPVDAASDRDEAVHPPRPTALYVTWIDTLAGLEPSGREMRPDGRTRGFFASDDIARIRQAGPLTEPAWTDDGEPRLPQPYPKGEARRQDVVAAHDA